MPVTNSDSPTLRADPAKPEAAGTASGLPSAARDFASHLRLWPVAAVGLALDLWSKQWAFTRLGPNEAWQIVPRLLSFRRTLNDGALFGLGKGLWLVFIVASVVAVGFVWYLFAHSTRDRRSLHVALALILAGALGNLYDRAFVMADIVQTGRGRELGNVVGETDEFVLMAPWPDSSPVRRILKTSDLVIRRQGVVRDFIKIEPRFGVDLWPWVFNVADVLLVIGVGLLLWNFWWERRAGCSQAADVSPRKA